MSRPNSFAVNFAAFAELFERMFPIPPKVEHLYLGLSEFEDVFKKDPAAGNQVYVQELLFRAHWAAITTIFRNLRWMNGMEIALKNPNYFCFCACLRGLVESAADSYDALIKAMWTLTEHFSGFEAALNRRFSQGVFVSDLEDILIHYSHARRMRRADTAAKMYRAKPAQEYLAAFEEAGSRGIRNLYAELCEITHPAASTVNFFAPGNPRDPNFVRFINPNDRDSISSLVDRHDTAFGPIFQKSFNGALLTLYVLNRFEDPRFSTSEVDELNFALPAFAEIEAKIAAARATR